VDAFLKQVKGFVLNDKSLERVPIICVIAHLLSQYNRAFRSPDGVDLFPNPTSKGVFLNSALSGNLKIVNGMGVLVTEHSLTASKRDWIDTSGFLNGFYFFVFQTEAGESVVKKVIVANN
jgi:hypothetical protein